MKDTPEDQTGSLAEGFNGYGMAFFVPIFLSSPFSGKLLGKKFPRSEEVPGAGLCSCFLTNILKVTLGPAPDLTTRTSCFFLAYIQGLISTFLPL